MCCVLAGCCWLRACRADQPCWSACSGILSLFQVLYKDGLKGLNCWSKGAVPWYLMLLLGLWRTRWLIWIDRTLQFAPNPGFGKAVINLNTGARDLIERSDWEV